MSKGQERAFLFNTKENKSFEVPTDQIYSLLQNPDSGFVPSDYDYAVQNTDTGEMGTIHGSQLKNALDQGYVIRNKKRAKAIAALKRDNSFGGVVTKQAIKEMFTLGFSNVDDNIKEGPYQQQVQSVFDEVYGTAKGVGTGVGFGGSIIASIIPGVAAARAASIGAKAAQSISKVKNGKKIFNNVKKVMSNPVGKKLLKTGKLAGYVGSKTPLGAVFNGTIKAGDEAKAFATALAKRSGIKNKIALAGIGKTAQYGAMAGIDATLIGAQVGYRAGKFTPSPEGEFNYKMAMQQGKDAFIDTALWSAGILGTFGVAGKAISSSTKFTTDKIANVAGKISESEIVKTAGKKVQKFSSGFFTKQFFKTTDSPKEFIKLRSGISNSSEFLNKNLDDDSLKLVMNNMSPETIKKAGIKNINDMKEVRSKLKNVIQNSDEQGLLTVLREGVLNLEKGNIPKTVKGVFEIGEKFRIKTGEKLQSLREVPTIEFKKGERYGNEISQQFKDNKYIQEVLFLRTPAVQKQVKNQMLAKDLMQIRTEEGMRNTAKKLGSQLKIRSLEDVQKYNKEIERYFIKEIKVSPAEAKEATKLYNNFARNNPEYISSITDMEVYRRIVNKKRLSLADIEELNDVVKRNSASKDPLVNPILGEIEDMSARAIRDFYIPKPVRISRKETAKIAKEVEAQLNVFERVLSKGVAIRKLSKIKGILNNSKNKYMSFEDLHELMKEAAVVANYAKQSGKVFNEEVFRNFYKKLSDFELKNFQRLSKSPGYENSAKELLENRSRYSFASNLSEIVDKSITKRQGGYFLNPRDGLNYILYGTLGGGAVGGLPGAVIGLGAAGLAQSIQRSGYGFLSASRKIDKLSGEMARANKFYRDIKDSKKNENDFE